MQLGRYQVSTLRPAPIHSITFSQDGRFFAVALETGYEVWRTYPLGLVRRRGRSWHECHYFIADETVLPGTLVRALLLPSSPLLVLQGGRNAPLYPPNKAVIYHDALGVPIAEVEFGERIRGIEARHSTLFIALSRRVVAFEYGMRAGDTVSVKGKGKASVGFWLRKIGEWETAENEAGLLAVSNSPGSTLLAMPGRQDGHVQLVHLPPCAPSSSQTPSHAFRSPIILAHTHSLSTVSCTATGSHLITTSERGTLLRVWDTARGRLERELRRGVDRAEMWGVVPEDGVFVSEDERRRKGGRVVGWSDKGTVHVWGDEQDPSALPFVHDRKAWCQLTLFRPAPTRQPSLTHLLSRNLPLPKYFSSTASSAQFHLPRKNPHAFASYVSSTEGEDNELAERFVVGWVEVQVNVDLKTESSEAGEDKKVRKRVSSGMGSREERRSSGSDATSRTATPTLRVETPTLLKRQSSGISGHTRSTSDRVRVKTAPNPGRKTSAERQLVVITYSGDWYRLRLPDPGEEGEVEGRKKGKCELVEYRRLGVGGGGW